VNDIILPAALACREAIFADHYRRQEAAQLAKQAAELTAKKLAAMPASETEAILFGRRFWPRSDDLDYSYSDLATASFISTNCIA